MPRKGHIAKRTVEVDPVYGSDLVTKFVNSMMWQGKKSTAEGIFYEALTKMEAKGGDEALKLFKKAKALRAERTISETLTRSCRYVVKLCRRPTTLARWGGG